MSRREPRGEFVPGPRRARPPGGCMRPGRRSLGRQEARHHVHDGLDVVDDAADAAWEVHGLHLLHHARQEAWLLALGDLLSEQAGRRRRHSGAELLGELAEHGLGLDVRAHGDVLVLVRRESAVDALRQLDLEVPVVVLTGQLVVAKVHLEVRSPVRKEVPGEALDLGHARRQRLHQAALQALNVVLLARGLLDGIRDNGAELADALVAEVAQGLVDLGLLRRRQHELLQLPVRGGFEPLDRAADVEEPHGDGGADLVPPLVPSGGPLCFTYGHEVVGRKVGQARALQEGPRRDGAWRSEALLRRRGDGLRREYARAQQLEEARGAHERPAAAGAPRLPRDKLLLRAAGVVVAAGALGEAEEGHLPGSSSGGLAARSGTEARAT